MIAGKAISRSFCETRGVALSLAKDRIDERFGRIPEASEFHE